jgi:hypothetical protein
MQAEHWESWQLTQLLIELQLTHPIISVFILAKA